MTLVWQNCAYNHVWFCDEGGLIENAFKNTWMFMCVEWVSRGTNDYKRDSPCHSFVLHHTARAGHEFFLSTYGQSCVGCMWQGQKCRNLSTHSRNLSDTCELISDISSNYTQKLLSIFSDPRIYGGAVDFNDDDSLLGRKKGLRVSQTWLPDQLIIKVLALPTLKATQQNSLLKLWPCTMEGLSWSSDWRTQRN